MKVVRLESGGVVHNKEGNVSGGDLVNNGPTAVALGNFDGMHIAHQELVRTTVLLARHHCIASAVLVLDPHPSEVLYHENNASHLSAERRPGGDLEQTDGGGWSGPKFIYKLSDKIRFLEEIGVDYLFILPCDIDVMRMLPREFVEEILHRQLSAHHVVTGYNFHFGYKRCGNIRTLEQLTSSLSIRYTVVNNIKFNNQEVSSSNIKHLLKLGCVNGAAQLLTRDYVISGVVSKGQRLASSKLGVATANIDLDDRWVQYPRYGVYLVKVRLDHHDSQCDKYGIANIGVRPTLHDDHKVKLEVHIFGDDNDGNGGRGGTGDGGSMELYGKEIVVTFIHMIRPERKFNSVDELKYQIHLDMKFAKYTMHNLGRMGPGYSSYR